MGSYIKAERNEDLQTTPNPTKKAHFDKGGSHLIKQVLNMKTLAVSLVVLCLLVTNGHEASGWFIGGGGGGGSNSFLSSIGPCWETWSRCTQWSSSGTGILWQSCQDRCVCKGYSSGTCREVRSTCPLSNRAWQCQCSGSRNGPKPGWCGF